MNFVYNGAETISFLSPTVWGIIPSEIKQKESLEAIKWEIKTWKPENCPCRLCKRAGVGLIIHACNYQ